MNYYLNVLDFKNIEEDVLKELSENTLELLKTNEYILLTADDIRERMAYEEFENSKCINLQLM
jgi:hypothetical protein